MLKEGDRVIITDASDGNIRIIGQEGTIKDDDGLCYLVYFDNDIGGHEGYGDCEYGKAYWVNIGSVHLLKRNVILEQILNN